MTDYTELIRQLKTYEDGYGLYDDATTAIEALQAEVDALKETLKAVQKNSGINFRMWEEAQAEVEQLKAEIIDCVCNGDLD